MIQGRRCSPGRFRGRADQAAADLSSGNSRLSTSSWAALPKTAWTPAIEADGSIRDGADVAEVTGFLDGLTAAGWPAGMRVIVRRERPHPGAQLSLFDQRDGLRYQAFATDTPRGQLAHLEARHRAHARVEDRIRQAKDTGIGRFPSRQFALNAAWLELALTAIDLIAWTQHLLWTATWPDVNPKRCATGCSTPRPVSPADNAGPTSDWPSTGNGPATWPPRSSDSP